MSIVKINNIIPKKLGEVVDCRDVPMDKDTPVFKERVIQVFRKLFQIEEGKENEQLETVWNMVKDPNKKMGIVALDGYYNDTPPYGSDIGICLNMGAPRLRARKFHQLDTIYLHLFRDNNTLFSRYYNSPYDLDETSFTFKSKVAAWHPHISGSNPCYGAYETRLYQYQRDDNIVLYLKTINQFLLTWNARSAFFRMNDIPMTVEYKPGERMLMSKSYNARFMGSATSDGFHRFLKTNYDKVEIKKDQIVEGLEGYIKLAWLSTVFSLKSTITVWAKNKITKSDHIPQIKLMKNISSEHEQYGLSSNPVGSILNSGSSVFKIRRLVKVEIEEHNQPSYIKTTDKYFHNTSWKPDEEVKHNDLVNMLYDLGYIVNVMYDNLIHDTLTEKIIEKGGIDDTILRIHNEWLEPMAAKLRDTSNEMTLEKNPRASRPVFSGTSFIYNGNDPDLDELSRRYYNRKQRVLMLLQKTAAKMINDEVIMDYINNGIKENFDLVILNNNSNPSIDPTSSGLFWKNNRVDYDQRNDPNSPTILSRLEWLKSDTGDVPSNFDEFIRVYNNIQVQINDMERNLLLRVLEKAKRKLQNGLQINNTRETVQQVPLFFD